jgi:hypothetical protein
MLKWGEENSIIHQFTHGMIGKRIFHPMKIRIQLHIFSCCIFAAAFALLVEQTS